MKKFFLINAGLLALAMTACQSEEPIGSNEPATDSSTSVLPTEGQFISINIANADDSKSSRADGSKFAYKEGDEVENKIDVKRLRFLFYYSDGTPFMMTGQNINSDNISTNMLEPKLVTAGNVNNETSTISNAMLVLGTPDPNSAGYQGDAIPSKIICVPT